MASVSAGLVARYSRKWTRASSYRLTARSHWASARIVDGRFLDSW